MSTPSIQTLITQAQQVLNLKSTNEIRATLAAVLANANVGTPLNPNLTTQQLWDEFYEIVRQPSDDIMSIVVDQMMRMVFSPPAPGGAGADKQVIFNDMGVLAGDAGLVYNKTTDALTVAGLVTAGSATITGAATVGTTLGVTGAISGASLALSGAGAAFTATATSGNSLNQITRPTTATAGGIQLKTSSTNDWIFGLRETSDSDFHLFSYGTVTDVLTVAKSTGNVTISTGNVVMATSGKGIDFSAKTPDGSGTLGSEILNDYEEGTWVPTLQFAGSSVGVQYSNRIGIYTKVGRIVHFSGRIDLTSKGTSVGDATIFGLPFAANTGAASVGYQSSIAPSDKQAMLTIDASSLIVRYASGTSTALSYNSDFSNNSIIIFAGTYAA